MKRPAVSTNAEPAIRAEWFTWNNSPSQSERAMRETMKCEKGLCLVCEKVIATKCGECGQSWKHNEHHTAVELKWSNGSRMSTPVCVECSRGPVWTADRAELTKVIWDAWDKLGATYDRNIVIV